MNQDKFFGKNTSIFGTKDLDDEDDASWDEYDEYYEEEDRVTGDDLFSSELDEEGEALPREIRYALRDIGQEIPHYETSENEEPDDIDEDDHHVETIEDLLKSDLSIEEFIIKLY